jgi:hypothetical protein
MPELRDTATDRPGDRPAETRDPVDVDRIKELNAVGDAKALDTRTPAYDPLEHVRPRDRREDPPRPELPERPSLLSLRDKVRAASEERFARSDAEDLAEEVGDDDHPGLERLDEKSDSGEDRDPEQLHRFGGSKDAPRPVRLTDLDVESWDEIVGPYAPTDPTDEVLGVSTFIDPYHPDVKLSGNLHRLPPDYQPPAESGLAIHADGRDVSEEAPHWWGHRTIYPTEPMTAGEFHRRVAALPWEFYEKRK